MDYNFGIQLKVRGDDYNSSFTNGHSMANSESVRRCKKVSEDSEKTVYEAEKYRVTAYHIPEKNAVKCYTVFENTSDEDITLDMFSSFCLEGIEADVIHRACSFWSAEGRLKSENLMDMNMEKSWCGHGTRIEKFGQIGSMPVRKWFPFAALENTKTGEFVAVQLYIASSWQIELFRNQDPLTLTGGIADFDFGHWCKIVKAGETFTSPRAVVAQGKTLNEVCDRLVKVQKPRIAEVDKDMPVICNEYCSSWGNPTMESVEKMAKKLSGTGVKYLVVDSGWYKQPDKIWWETIGDWNPSKELFPNGIKEMCDMIKSYGLIPGIWFEFEKVAVLSEVYNKTEHLLKRDGIPLTVDRGRFLDMRDDWCIDYLTEKVIDFLRDNGFGYIKIDYNENIGVGCDGAESLGEGLRQTVLATERFFKKITDELPDLVVECCSSGGHRLEPSMLELCSQASFSDAHECTSIPVIAANVHRFMRPEQSQIWASLREKDDIHRTNYSLAAGFLGRLCLSGEIYDLNDEAWKSVTDAIAFYEKAKEIIRDGSTTIIDCNAVSYNDPTGYQAVLRELGEKSLLVVHTFRNGANPPIEKYLEGRKIVGTFGSELDDDFRGKVFLLENR